MGMARCGRGRPIPARRRRKTRRRTISPRCRERPYPWEEPVAGFGHGDRSLDPLIQQKTQLWRITDVDPLGDFRLKEARRALQAAKRQFLACFVAHY